MVEITLLKLEVDDSTMTANAPFSGRSEPGESEDEEVDGEVDDEGPGLFPLLAGVAFLVAIAVAVRKLRGGEEADVEEEVEALA